MPSQRARPLAGSAGERSAAHPLRPRCIYIAAATSAAGAAEQTRDLCPVIPGERRDDASGRTRSEASRRRDRFLQRPPYVEPETPASSPRSLCGSRRRSGPGPLAMDRLAAEVFPAGLRSQRSVPRQVRGGPKETAGGAQTRLPRNTHPAAESEGIGGVASSAVPLLMGGLLQTSFWRRATCTSLSRPVHPSGGDFEPSTRRARRRRRALLPLCMRLLAESGRTRVEAAPEGAGPSSPPLWTCPQCGGPMVLIGRLSALDLRMRSPPVPAEQQP